ncbi:hypothetical protein [Jeotgalibacillus soli]|uniref:Major facilitator superfamily (MFS) profile domain-containing protein n=1 Tax=Jeotgalibacillus soli TaxID=889306 RepID=A0A0C2RHE5_9BACL|nr:hypothetical protein [Jeotgalibacillus soli]KIL49580.1 hypothetical protein KP78_10480 [Jeotgalibacillus soli]
MGRVTSFYGLVQSAGQILFVLLAGFLGDIFPLRMTIISLALLNLFSIMVLIWVMMHKRHQALFLEAERAQKKSA